jgi:hypothetical protein
MRWSYDSEFVFLVEACRKQQREEVDEEVGMLANHQVALAA